jgi:hypothetical protein
VKTVTVDDRKRVRVPNAKPGQVFAFEPKEDGTVVLVPVKADQKEAFPRGSLLKYFTPEKNAEELALMAGCVQGPLESQD